LQSATFRDRARRSRKDGGKPSWIHAHIQRRQAKIQKQDVSDEFEVEDALLPKFKQFIKETKNESPILEAEVIAEKQRRVEMAELQHERRPGNYGGDPAWDDIVPLPQDDGDKPLAAIAYSDDYAEGIYMSCFFLKSYLSLALCP
jgi:hypothetical protein